MSENSYIYWDEEYVYMQCVECHAKNGKGTIWPAAMGYRDRVVCECGKVIHQGDDEQDSETQTTV